MQRVTIVNMDHMKFIHPVADSDMVSLKEKEGTYQGSWKKRGGIGAFMMLARKWDRLEAICEEHCMDIFDAIERDDSGADGTALAEIRDLRRYLILVEAEMMARGFVHNKIRRHVDGTPKEDSNRHATDDFVQARESLGATIEASQSDIVSNYASRD